MKWRPQKLETLAAEEQYAFVGGPFGSKLTTRDYVSEGVPVIRGTNLNNGRFLGMDDFVFVTETKVRDDLSSNLAAPGDLVFTQRGTLGQVAIIPDEGISDQYVISQSQMKLTVDGSKADARFLYYYFSSRETVQRILNYISSSGVPHINLTVLRNFELPVPPPKTQRTIADLLSTYDDLIENNRRRIQLLEESARLLYKEWFVHLRFPGHEHVTITDGVPDGWEPRTLAEVTTKIGSGATPRGGAAAYKTEGITLIRSMNVYDFDFADDGLAFIDESQADKLANVVVEPLDILLNITGASVARCCMVPSRHLPARVNQHVMIVRVDPEECGPHYVIHTINSHQQKENLLSVARAGGATREALTKDVVRNISFSVPPGHLLDEFERVTGRLFEQQQNLAAQNEKLTRARDLLLPRLMSGELVV